jgi:uncharacterized protein YfeS
MDVWVSTRSYNSFGGSYIFSLVGELLAARLNDYGSGVEFVELVACLRSRTRKFPPTLEDMFDRFHDHFVRELPLVTFRRKLKRIEITFLSEHFYEGDDARRKASPGKYKTAAEEVAGALPLLKRRIKPTDDFDADRFLADASRVLAVKFDSLAEWEEVRKVAEAKRSALRATKTPWELLEIDWSLYHPKAREVLDDPFFWECTDDAAPHGNDTGADLLEEYRRWDKRNRTRSPLDFLARLQKGWGIEPIDWSLTDPDAVKRLDQDNPIAMSICNESAIALAFAVVKMRGECPADVSRRALAALTRTAILVKDSSLCDEIKASWREAIAKMKGKLESLQR